MEDLCRAYWYPLYAHARSRGCTAEDAEDLTQTFFAQMLARETMQRVSPEGGRLRSYLLSALNNLIAQDWRNRNAQKRGGGAMIIPLDQAAAEERLAGELMETTDPLRLFNRRWAVALLQHVMEQLEAEYARQGQSSLYAHLEPFAGGHDGSETGQRRYRECAAAACVSEGYFRVLVFRFRKRYRQLLRQEVAETVQDPSMVDEEIGELFGAVTAS